MEIYAIRCDVILDTAEHMQLEIQSLSLLLHRVPVRIRLLGPGVAFHTMLTLRQRLQGPVAERVPGSSTAELGE